MMRCRCTFSNQIKSIVVCQASRSASATELRWQLHWLPIRQRIAYNLAVITYCTRSTGTPVYLTDFIKIYHPSRTLRSADKLLLSVPRMTLALSAKVFSVSAPSVWNSLSYNCRSAESFSSFRRALQTELFDTAYNSLPSPARHAPLFRLRHMALYKCVLID